MHISAISGSEGVLLKVYTVDKSISTKDVDTDHSRNLCLKMRVKKMREALWHELRQLINTRDQISMIREDCQGLFSRMKNFACYEDSMKTKKTLQDFTQIPRTFENSHEDRSNCCTTQLEYDRPELSSCLKVCQMKERADDNFSYSKRRNIDDEKVFEKTCNNQVQLESCFPYRKRARCFYDCIQYDVDAVVLECHLYEQDQLEESLLLAVKILKHMLAISCCSGQRTLLQGKVEITLVVPYQRVNLNHLSEENCSVEDCTPQSTLKTIAHTEAHPRDSDEKDNNTLITDNTNKDQCSEKVVNNVKAIPVKSTRKLSSSRQICNKRKVGLFKHMNVWLVLAFILPYVCAFPISNEISRSSSEITISKQILLTQTCNHYTLYDLSNSCQPNGELLKITINNCKFRELCNYEEEPVCINTQYHWGIICQNRNMKCAKGRMIKTWIDKNNPDVMNLKEQQCPKGYFQPYESDCFDACKHKHRDLEDMSEKYLVHSKGTDTSPSMVYCNYKKGYYGTNKGTYLLDYDSEEQHDPYFCVKGNVSAICTDGGILLPNGTCVKKCVETFYRDAYDGFKCKPLSVQKLQSSVSPTVQVSVDNKDKDKETISSGGRSEDKHTPYLPTWLIILIILSAIVIAVVVTVTIICVCKKFELCANCSKERQHQTEQDLSRRLFDSGEPFKKPFDSTLDQFSMEHHTKLMESVGVLIVKQTPAGTPRKAGTVFRVGTRFLMTARHVIKSIVDPKDTGKPDWSFFKNGNIYVNFNASLLCTGRVDYDVEFILSSDDQDLDFAILGITSTRPLPNKMLLQSEFETLNEKQVSIMGFGHTTNYNNKHIDTGCQIVSPNSKRVLKAKKYVKLNSTHFKSILCEENGQGPSIVDRCYSAIDRRHNLTTDCFMEHGASGAPAVTPSGWVVGFLTDGLPELYFKLPENEQKRFSPKHRFEIILKMDYIYIYLKDEYPELAADIFNK